MISRIRVRRWYSLLTVIAGSASPLLAQDTIPLAFEVAQKVAPDLSRDPRLSWLQMHAAPVRSVDPSDRDFRDLEPLRQAIGHAQVVLLGEATHGDGTTFLAKTRLIQFLHEEMGFDVLAFEGGLYSVAKSWELIRQGQHARAAMHNALFAGARRTREKQALFEYIEARARTKRPLEVAGFDPQLSGTASRDFLGADLAAQVRKIGVQTTALDQGAPFRSAIEALGSFGGYTPPEPWFADTLAIFQRQIAERTIPDDIEAGFWTRVLDGVRQQALSWRDEKVVAQTEEEKRRAGLRGSSARDEQMGRNLVWLAQDRYPNRRIIVWAATVHTNYEEPSPRAREVMDREGIAWRPMGQVAHEVLGDRMYGIGFTAYTGSSFNPGARATTRWPVQHTEGVVEFEDLMHATGLEYAFVDLRDPAEGGAWLREPMYARPYGNTPFLASWGEILDGLFYMREQRPATPVTP